MAVPATGRPGTLHCMAGSAHPMRIILAKSCNMPRIDLFPVTIPAFSLKCRLMVLVRERNPVFHFEYIRIFYRK
jgi:hypothetical protein